jgi:hypothetical protein
MNELVKYEEPRRVYSRKKKDKGKSRSKLMKEARRRKIKRKQTIIFNQPLEVRLLNNLLIKRESQC